MVAVWTVLDPRSALVGTPRVMITVSSTSSIESSLTVMVILSERLPAGITTGLEVIVKSCPAPSVAFPLTLKGTVTSSPETWSSWTVAIMEPMSSLPDWEAVMNSTVGRVQFLTAVSEIVEQTRALTVVVPVVVEVITPLAWPLESVGVSGVPTKEPGPSRIDQVIDCPLTGWLYSS